MTIPVIVLIAVYFCLHFTRLTNCDRMDRKDR